MMTKRRESVRALFSIATSTVTALFAVCGAAGDLQSVRDIVEKEIADGIVHGAAVAAGDADGVRLSGAWGWTDATHAVPMTTRTVIDVASVTKATAGVTAFLVAHARGQVDFDAPFTNALRSYRAPLGRPVTIRDLANHRSGFGETEKGGRPYLDKNPTNMLDKILSFPPAVPEPDAVNYACRNYVLLGQLLEQVVGRRVDDFCRTEIFGPVGMNDTSLGAPLPTLPRTRLAQTMAAPGPGVISDFVARPLWAAGIGTFNAGLFTTAEDLARLMRVYLRGGVCDNGTRLFGPAEVAEVSRIPDRRMDGTRSFGWLQVDTVFDAPVFEGVLFHSGWSGQSVFFDLKRQRFAVVLTTRCGDYDRAKRDRGRIAAALLAAEFSK